MLSIESSEKPENIMCGALVQHATIGILVSDVAGLIVQANSYAENIFGYLPGELLNKPLEILVPAELTAKHAGQRAGYVSNPAPRLMGTRIDLEGCRKDGSLFPAEISLTHLDIKGEFYVAAFVADISEQKKTEAKLRMDEQRIRLLIEHTPAAVAMFDTEMQYIAASKRWVEDYRIGNRDIIGRRHYEIFPEIGNKWKKLHKRCILNGEHFKNDEEKFERKDGTIDWIKWELTPWYVQPGKVGGVILFTEVVTKHKEAQLALQNLNETLESRVLDKTKELVELLEREKGLSDLKSRFISTASHEFRTPLTIILSSATLLESYDTAEYQQKVRRHLNQISSSVNSIASILDDFLSLERLGQGKIPVQKEIFDLHAFLEDVIAEMNTIYKKTQRINLFYRGKRRIRQDTRILKNIMVNLLSNSIKYSADNQEIDLTADVNSGVVRIIVRDYGIGIPADDQKNIFSSFFRASNVGSAPGTGLGLNIVRKYLELLGGTVSFISLQDAGSTFIVSLPG